MTSPLARHPDIPGAAGGASVSVVVTSIRSPSLLEASLEALLPQCVDRGAEVIVARADSPAELADLARRFPNVRVAAAPAGSDIPRLRGTGMLLAAGDLVAVTEDHCLVQPGWLEALATAARDADVVGGSVGNARSARAVDRAAYYSEYGFFSWTRPPDAAGTPALTGANVAYARTVTAEVARWALDGAWESVVHQRLAARGCRLAFAPDARVLQNATFGFGAFCVDRWQHGRDHARARSAGQRPLRRWLRVCGSPIVPAVLLWRVYRAAAGQGHLPFLTAMPWTVGFLAAWSAGEAAGYASGAERQEVRGVDVRS